jgi:hypothetical protein
MVTQMNTLLERAHQSARKAQADIEFKRLDRAYVEWLVSSDVLLEVIPRHRGYPDLNTSRGDQLNRYRALYKVRNPILSILYLEHHPTICGDYTRNWKRFWAD